MNEGKMFIKISNKDIFDKIIKLEEQNNIDHGQIITRLDQTNGKVKLSKWIATTAITLSVVIIGLLFEHMHG